MKAILEFNLPEDQHEYDVIMQASKAQSFLWSFSEQLRDWYKYGHSFADANDAVEKIRDEFYRLLNDYNVDMDL